MKNDSLPGPEGSEETAIILITLVNRSIKQYTNNMYQKFKPRALSMQVFPFVRQLEGF